MNALLVWPKLPLTYCGYEYILPIVGKKSANIPLGILTVAAMLPKNWNIKFIDTNVSELKLMDILSVDAVFISAMLIQKKSVEDIIRLANKYKKPVIMGGPYATACYKEIKGVKHFILGEAENNLPEFLNDLKKGLPKPIYKNDKKPDLEKIPPPLPRLDLINPDDYLCTSIQYSRGCPFHCEFCDVVEMLGHKPRTKSIERMLAEFNHLYSYGWRGNVFIVDDNFIGNKLKAVKLLPYIIDWQKRHKYPFDLFTEVSMNVVEDGELLRLMREAGFGSLFMGIETPNKKALKGIGKTQNLRRDSLEVIRTVQNAGMEVIGSFIVGFDDDDYSIFQQQMQFIQESGIPLALVGMLTALPGTRLFKRLKKEGRLLLRDSSGISMNLKLNFEPKMGYDNLLNGYKILIKELYSPKLYFKRCLSLFDNLKSNGQTRKFKLEYIKILYRVLKTQIFSPYGLHYLQYLIVALLTKPKFFTEIFRLGLEYHHIYTITNNILK